MMAMNVHMGIPKNITEKANKCNFDNMFGKAKNIVDYSEIA